MKDSKPCNPMMFIVTWICFFWWCFYFSTMGFITIFHHHLDPNLCWKLVLFRIEEQYANKSKVFEWAIQLDLFLVLILSRWWFQICSIFTPIWGRFPFWLIFFRWVETTNQLRRMRKTPPRKHLKSIKMGKIMMMIKRKNESPTAAEIVQEMKDQGLNWCYQCGQKTFVRKQLLLLAHQIVLPR